MLPEGIPPDDWQRDRVLEVEAHGRTPEGHAHAGEIDELAAGAELVPEQLQGAAAGQDGHPLAGIHQPSDERQVARGVAQPPGADGEQDASGHQPRWGLLVEDELKTGAATLVQDTFRSVVAWLFYAAASVTNDVVVHGREHV